MPNPQPGIFARVDAAQLHLEFDLIAGAQARALAAAIVNAPIPHATNAGINLVAGFRPDRWRDIDPARAPDGVHAFATIAGRDGYTMPATQHDAWVWLTGPAPDVLFDAARRVIATVSAHATLAFECAGWSYRDSRDLTGFEDGTGNPNHFEAPAIALYGEGPFAGGSVALVQQWKHDLAAFERLDDDAQAKVIGRTKRDSIELDDTGMPPDAHVARTTIEIDGEEQPVWRRSVPWGNVREHGLMFLAFTREQSRLQRMLERMAGAEDGTRDALTRYSTPLTGAFYLVPPAEALARLVVADE